MSHVRRKIRDAVVARLTGLSRTGTRVYSGRTRTLAKDHQPSLLVYATEESSDTDAMGSAAAMGAVLLRVLTLAVEGRAVASASDDLENTLDGIAEEVEVAMVADPSLGGLAFEVTLTATRITALSPGESHAGEVRMEYRVGYRTREKAPAVAV